MQEGAARRLAGRCMVGVGGGVQVLAEVTGRRAASRRQRLALALLSLL